ncbi:MAG TPA: ABC transporter permease subunit [Candidatus Limnocylindria bacterium]|nr:ABC transporter permease subunit [Candidatus Limnocylindria bacterium]
MPPAKRQPFVWGVVSLVATALLVIWITDLAIHAAPLDDLTLGLLLRGRAPFRDLTLAEALWTAVSRSAILLGAAVAAAVAIGVGAGAAFAFSRSPLMRGPAWVVGTVGASLPSFFWAMVLQLVVVIVYLRTGRLLAPVGGGFAVDAHLILPAIALAMRPAAYIFRTTATALEDARHAPHVVTAWAKGLGPLLVAQRHVGRNAAPAILAGIALGAKTALSSLAIIEFVFTWNGAGYGFILAVATGNVAFASAIALVFAVALSLLGGLVAVATRAVHVTSR